MYKIEEMLLTPNKWSRPQKAIKEVKAIVVHYVANALTSAKANRDYFESRKGGMKSFGSTHEIIDLDGDVVIIIPKNEVSYNCGASTYTKLKTEKFDSANPNYNTYSIECTHVDDDGEMSSLTYNTLVERVADLCIEFKLNYKTDVLLHNDITGKICHKWFVDDRSRWDAFLIKVRNTIKEKESPTMTKKQELEQLLKAHSYPISNLDSSVKQFGVDSETAKRLIALVKIEEAQKPRPSAKKPFQLTYKRSLHSGVGNGEDIRQLETALQMLGYDLSRYVDNKFGTSTKRAVLQFQKDFNIEVDGYFGRGSVAKMNEVLADIGGNYSMITHSSSCVHIYETDATQDVDAELGIRNKLEKLSQIKNTSKEYAQKTPVCRINAGFFSPNSTLEHIGTYVDEGLYYKNPNSRFIDFIYYKNGKTEIKNIKNLQEVAKLQPLTKWAVGTSYSLVIDGKIKITNTAEFGHHTSYQPRTMIGQKPDGTFVLVVVNGRGKNGSRGMTSKQQAQLMLELGCFNAVNLDGGGSSEMVLHALGKDLIVNEPTDGVERRVGSTLMVYND